MGEFQLILLSERERPVRLAEPTGGFCLIPFSSAWMTEAATKLTPEMFASWWTPLEALAYTSRCVSFNGANKALWQLLVSGMIAAIATSSSATEESYAPQTSTEPRFIPKSQWKDFTATGSDLWTGAYARFWSVGTRGSRPTTRLAFGIKFNPNDVRPNLPPPNPIFEAEVMGATSSCRTCQGYGTPTSRYCPTRK